MADEEGEEGMDFASQFTAAFGKNPAATEQRLKDERRAGLTAKQKAARKAKGPPKKQTNFRATAQTLAQIDALVELLQTDKTAVIAMAIDALAKAKLN